MTMLVLMFGLANVAGAAESTPLETKLDSQAPAAGFYAARINGEVVDDRALFVRVANGSVFVALETLRDWNLVPPAHCGATYKGDTFCALGGLPAARVTLNAAKQEYDIEVAARALPTTNLDLLRHREADVQPARERAAFLNYDLNALWGGALLNGSPRTMSGLLEGGVTAAGGTLTTNLLGQTGNSSRPKLSLLSTTWRHDDVGRHATLLIGDAVTTGGSFGNEFRFSGIQWSSNFDTDRSFVTSPTVALSGLANVASVIDLYVNNALKYSKDVPTGPFEVNTLPTVDGQGQVRVVVRDLLGRQQVITGSFYGTPSVLKRGLDDFAYQAGFERINYGYRALQYGPFFFEGNDRRGITDRFTAELHAELEAPAQEVGLIGNWLVPNVGIFNAGIAGSHGSFGHGTAGLIGYNYQREHVSFGASVQAASPGFQQIGDGGSDVASSRQTSVHFGLQNDRDSLGIAYAEQTQFGSYASKVLTVSLSRDLRHGDLQLNGRRTVGPGGGLGVDLSYHVALGRRRSLNIETDHEGTYRDDRIEISQARPPGGFGDASRLQIDSGDTNALSAQLAHWGATGSSVFTATAAANALQVGTELKGGIAFVDHDRYLTPRLLDAFGMVHVGYPHVRVYEDDRLIGVTNPRGDLIVPDLSAYTSAEISIEKKDLPRGVVVAEDHQNIVPTYRAAASIRFTTKYVGSPLIPATTPTGNVSSTVVGKPIVGKQVVVGKPIVRKPVVGITQPLPKMKIAASLGNSLNSCAVRPLSDAARSACLPLYVRDVLKERKRLDKRCESEYRDLTPILSHVLRKYCGDWASRNTSVAFDGTVKSKDADPLLTDFIGFKRLLAQAASSNATRNRR